MCNPYGLRPTRFKEHQVKGKFVVQNDNPAKCQSKWNLNEDLFKVYGTGVTTLVKVPVNVAINITTSTYNRQWHALRAGYKNLLYLVIINVMRIIVISYIEVLKGIGVNPCRTRKGLGNGDHGQSKFECRIDSIQQTKYFPRKDYNLELIHQLLGLKFKWQNHSECCFFGVFEKSSESLWFVFGCCQRDAKRLWFAIWQSESAWIQTALWHSAVECLEEPLTECTPSSTKETNMCNTCIQPGTSNTSLPCLNLSSQDIIDGQFGHNSSTNQILSKQDNSHSKENESSQMFVNENVSKQTLETNTHMETKWITNLYLNIHEAIAIVSVVNIIPNLVILGLLFLPFSTYSHSEGLLVLPFSTYSHLEESVKIDFVDIDNVSVPLNPHITGHLSVADFVCEIKEKGIDMQPMCFKLQNPTTMCMNDTTDIDTHGSYGSLSVRSSPYMVKIPIGVEQTRVLVLTVLIIVTMMNVCTFFQDDLINAQLIIDDHCRNLVKVLRTIVSDRSNLIDSKYTQTDLCEDNVEKEIYSNKHKPIRNLDDEIMPTNTRESDLHDAYRDDQIQEYRNKNCVDSANGMTPSSNDIGNSSKEEPVWFLNYSCSTEGTKCPHASNGTPNNPANINIFYNGQNKSHRETVNPNNSRKRNKKQKHKREDHSTRGPISNESSLKHNIQRGSSKNQHGSGSDQRNGKLIGTGGKYNRQKNCGSKSRQGKKKTNVGNLDASRRSSGSVATKQKHVNPGHEPNGTKRSYYGNSDGNKNYNRRSSESGACKSKQKYFNLVHGQNGTKRRHNGNDNGNKNTDQRSSGLGATKLNDVNPGHGQNATKRSHTGNGEGNKNNQDRRSNHVNGHQDPHGSDNKNNTKGNSDEGNGKENDSEESRGDKNGSDDANRNRKKGGNSRELFEAPINKVRTVTENVRRSASCKKGNMDICESFDQNNPERDKGSKKHPPINKGITNKDRTHTDDQDKNDDNVLQCDIGTQQKSYLYPQQGSTVNMEYEGTLNRPVAPSPNEVGNHGDIAIIDRSLVPNNTGQFTEPVADQVLRELNPNTANAQEHSIKAYSYLQPGISRVPRNKPTPVERHFLGQHIEGVIVHREVSAEDFDRSSRGKDEIV